MKGITDDRSDPDLKVVEADGMQKKYLVLSEEERAKGFVRPVRTKYVHHYMLDGSDVPMVLTSTKGLGGCGALTVMGLALAETYASDPSFYGATFCVGCRTHLPVGEFHWDIDRTTKTYQKVGS